MSGSPPSPRWVVYLIALGLATGVAGCGPSLTAAGILGLAVIQAKNSADAANPPTISVEAPDGATNDIVEIEYRLTDFDPSDRADVVVEFSQDSGATFAPATQAFVDGAEGLTNLTTSDTGVDHFFFWNTADDLGALNVTGVQVRVTVRPSGEPSGVGNSATTSKFDVLNRFMTTLAAQSTSTELLPTAITIGTQGDIYLSDASGHRVLRASKASGTTTVLAGTGTAGFEEGNLTATSAQLNFPIGIGVTTTGDVLIADFLNAALRRVQTANGFLTVVGGQGDSQTDGELAANSFFLPRDLALDRQDNAFILTEDNRVRVVNLAGTGNLSFSFGTTTCTSLPSASISLGAERVHSLLSGDPGCGTGSSAYTQKLSQGRSLALEDTTTERVAYVLDVGGFGTGFGGGFGGTFPQLIAVNLGSASVSRFSPRTNSVVSILPGDAFLLADRTTIQSVGTIPDMAVGRDGALIISSFEANRVFAINIQTTSVQVAAQTLLPGEFVAVLGSGIGGFEGDGLPGASAQLFFPTAVAGDAQGNVYVGESSGRLRVVAGSSGLTFAGQTTAAGLVGTLPVAVPGTIPEPVSPNLIAQNRSGDLFFSDTSASDPRSNRVFRLNPSSGALATVLGNGSLGDSGDGGPATEARVGQIGSPAISPDGRVLVVPDVSHHRIRAVNLTRGPLTFLGVQIAAGEVETVVGVGQITSGTTIPLGDGGPATLASLNLPVAVDFDQQGLLWISDAGNHRIRVANPTDQSQTVLAATIAPNRIQTVVGTGARAAAENSGDGGPAGQADLNKPGGLLGPDGNFYLLEDSLSGEGRLRVVNLSSTTIQRGAVSIPVGAIATAAGSGLARLNDNSNLGDGGAALAATFRRVAGLTISSSNLVFVSDGGDHRIRVINLGQAQQLNGVSIAVGGIETAVGTGVPAFGGDPGVIGAVFSPGQTASPIDEPGGVLFFDDGRLIVLDTNNGALRMGNFATSPRSLAGATATPGQLVIVAGERAGKGRAQSPRDVRVNAAGEVLFSDEGASQRSPAVLRLDPKSRVVTRIAGSGRRTAGDGSDLGDGGPALSATFAEVAGIDLDTQGNLYVCDGGNRRVRFVNTTSSALTPVPGLTVEPNGIGSVLSGAGGDNNTDNDDGQSITTGSVDLLFPISVGVASNALWVVDEGSQRLLRVDTTTGTVAGVFSRTVLGTGTGTLAAQSGFTILNDSTANFTSLGVQVGDLVQFGGQQPRVIAVVDAQTLALGTPPPSAATVGNYSIQRDDQPRAVAALSDTVAYLAVQSVQRGGGRLLRVTHTGSALTTTTIAGNGDPAWNGDLLTASALQFGQVGGMHVSGDLLLLADSTSHRIIGINIGSSTLTVADLTIGAGEARTLAGGGQGAPGFNGDAIPPHLALLNRPTGVGVEPRNEIVLVDAGNGRVRRFER
ncbi:MAG: hypothetical protein JKY65_22490 [Planctomycetes bacterium]|nr:hypothetical protein [Planctomycetota bacterium]